MLIPVLFRYISIQSTCQSLAEFLEKFPFFTPIVAGDINALERVAYEFVEDQAIQGILYTETRYSPHCLTAKNLTPDQVSIASERTKVCKDETFSRSSKRSIVVFSVE